MGIEPSVLSDVGRSNGLEVIRAYFSPDIFKDESVDCFILMHVFEHFEDPFLMLKTMKQKLSSGGKIIIEVPYFSGEHHQHLFFYNLTFLKRLCFDIGLYINSVEIDDDTETLRIVLNRFNNGLDINALERPVDILDLCLRKNTEYKKRVERINELLQSKEKIVWWGAGSLSVVYLNQINCNILDDCKITIVDGDKNKWGMYIPIINKEVHPFSIFNEKEIENLIIASSFAGEIKETLKFNNISVKNMETFIQ
jgi:hypothetical protein